MNRVRPTDFDPVRAKNFEIDSLSWIATFFSFALCWCASASAQTNEPSIGKKPTEKYLIIHADDAGMSHSVNLATIQGLESGIVTSASIMVPCPWFKEFATYAHQHPQYDYGIHLTLNSEWDVYRWGPVASPSLVPSLLDGEGYLWDNVSQVAKHAKAEEVRTELRAQIDRAKAFGVPLSHLDTHMGAIVSRPDLVDVYIDLALEYHLPILFMRQMDDSMKREYPALASRLEIGVAKLAAKKLPMLDTLLQFYGGEQPSKRLAEYERALNNLPAGVTQLIIHCGIDNGELRGISDSSPRRDQDRRIFTDPATKRLIQANGIKLLSWKELGGVEYPNP